MEFFVPLLTLIALEVILGVDNIIFISILSDKLPPEQRNKLRFLGIGLAMVMRLALLGFISWILKLDKTLFSIADFNFTGKGLILILGGAFLLYKSIKELNHKANAAQGTTTEKKATFNQLLLQVIALDLVFSIDSIITAVGMVKELWVMYVAVIVTVIIMLFASKPISENIRKYPTFKVLALCFLLLIGVALIAEGFGYPIPKEILYGAMAFSFLVDIIQIKTIKNLETN